MQRVGGYVSCCFSLVSLVAIAPKAIALPVTETAEQSTAQSVQSPNTPTDATVHPFYNLNHQEAGGHVGTTGVSAFYPLFQTVGQDLMFVVGNLNVNNTGHLGGGLQSGYRQRLGDRAIWGMYGGLDIQSIGDHTFTQAGFGSELLGDNWALHLNGNVPLGATRQVTASGSQGTNPRFQGSQLLLDQNFMQRIASAVTTLSLDAGLQLVDLGEGSVLWGRGGVYYLGGDASRESLGLRLALDQHLQNNIRLGAGIQHDEVFGTNMLFSANILIGAPDQRPSAAGGNLPRRLWSRAAEPLVRTNTILVEEQVSITGTQTGVAAINPATGRPYDFLHVAPAAGVANGAGTIESPRDTIANAVAIATPNADNIIYVQAGNAGGAFTIPAGVQVRSVGPTQVLPTQFGMATLPGSGSGTLPAVTGQVTMTDNTLLSGFAIDSARANAISASGAGITIEDNTITNADRGIDLPDINGAVTIARNQISNTTRNGILFGDIDGNDNTNITISNNQLTTIGSRGIEFDFIEDNATANITISNNQITAAQQDGIRFNNIRGNARSNISVVGNTITTAGSQGIRFNGVNGDANATLNITDNQISNTTLNSINLNNITDDAAVTSTIANNNIINSNANGIRVQHTGNTNICLDLRNNTVTTPANNGFVLRSTGAGQFQIVDLANIPTLNAGTFNTANGVFVSGTQGIAPCP